MTKNEALPLEIEALEEDPAATFEYGGLDEFQLRAEVTALRNRNRARAMHAKHAQEHRDK